MSDENESTVETPADRTVPSERWEEVGRKALTLLLQDRRAEVDRAVGDLVATLDYGTPVDETHLQNLRDAIEALETVVEHDVTDLLDGAVPFERTAGRVPVGRLYDALEVDRDDVRALADSGGT